MAVVAFCGNLLWFIFGGGIFACLLWALVGLIFCCTVVGIPFGVAAFRIAGFAAFPFGRELVDVRLFGRERVLGTGVANFLWIIFSGLWLAIGHVLAGISCFLAFFMVIPVFFGIAHFKLAAVCFAPLGKKAVPSEVAALVHNKAAEDELGVISNNI